MKFVKLFEDFYQGKTGWISEDKIKEDFDGILIELIDNGFHMEYDFSKPYNRNDEIQISIYHLNGGDSSLLFEYDDVKEYIKTIKDYMDIYYNNIPVVIFRNGDKHQATTNEYDKFILDQEEFHSSKESINEKFWFIRLNFKIKNKKS